MALLEGVEVFDEQANFRSGEMFMKGDHAGSANAVSDYVEPLGIAWIFETGGAAEIRGLRV